LILFPFIADLRVIGTASDVLCYLVSVQQHCTRGEDCIRALSLIEIDGLLSTGRPRGVLKKTSSSVPGDFCSALRSCRINVQTQGSHSTAMCIATSPICIMHQHHRPQKPLAAETDLEYNPIPTGLPRDYPRFPPLSSHGRCLQRLR